METQTTTQAFKPRFTTIKGLSDRVRLPRLGIIRLGLKKKSAKSGNEYPVEVDYFVCPEEVQAKFGLTPKELNVRIPINDIETVFPTSYKYYGSSKGLKCQGNGEIAYRINEQTKEMDEVECPCQLLDDGKCKQSATLNVIIDEVSVGGCYQVRTSSTNSIIDIKSGLLFTEALLGYFSMVPMILKRVKIETHHDGKKQNHYTMQISLNANSELIDKLRLDSQRIQAHPKYILPAPKDENPEFDPVDIIEEETDPGSKDPEAEPQGKPIYFPPEKENVEPPQFTLQERRAKIISDLKTLNYSSEDIRNLALVKTGSIKSSAWEEESVKALEDEIKKLQPPEPERTVGMDDN